MKKCFTFQGIKSIFLVSLVIMLGQFSNQSEAAKLYKWVDENGKVSYQDRPPPSNGTLLKESSIDADQASAVAVNDDRAPVMVYTIEDCDTCELVLFRLSQLNVPTQELSLLNREIQQRVLTESNSLSAPTLRIGDKFVTDISEQNLITELRTAGYLNGEEFEDSSEAEAAENDETEDDEEDEDDEE